MSYGELHKPIDAGKPEFPETCPDCGAGIKTTETDRYMAGPVYECEGQYTLKPQIQNHTNKWWGSCPVTYAAKLAEKTLLAETGVCPIWVVRENGRRFHVASFTNSSEAEKYARHLSSDFPYCWNDGSRVAYIETTGGFGGYSGVRFAKGEMIARKDVPHHIKGAGRERVWIHVEQIHLGQYRMGEIISD
jgi:hypothetical protein